MPLTARTPARPGSSGRAELIRGPKPLPVRPAPQSHRVDSGRRPGVVQVAARSVPIGTPLAGRRVTLRLDGTLLQVIDADQDAGTLLRSLPFPLTSDQLVRIRGSRPAGPAPQPAAGLLRVERRVSCRGAIMVARQRIHLGIQHAGKTVTVEVDDDTFTVQHGPDILLVVGRTGRKEVARFKARKPEGPRKIV